MVVLLSLRSKETYDSHARTPTSTRTHARTHAHTPTHTHCFVCRRDDPWRAKWHIRHSSNVNSSSQSGSYDCWPTFVPACFIFCAFSTKIWRKSVPDRLGIFEWMRDTTQLYAADVTRCVRHILFTNLRVEQAPWTVNVNPPNTVVTAKSEYVFPPDNILQKLHYKVPTDNAHTFLRHAIQGGEDS